MDNMECEILAIHLPFTGSLVYTGISLDASKTTLSKKNTHQEFVRDEVFIRQSIDPYQRMSSARQTLASGGSLFMSDNSLNKR